MDIKLIALDLDGTLLDNEKRLSEQNRRALSECAERGIYIVPATGRTVDGIPDEVKEIPGVRYAITTNGAVIADLIEKETIDKREMDCALALELLELAEQFHVMYDAYIDGRGITESKFYGHLESYGLTPVLMEMVYRTRDVYDNIIRYVREGQRPVEKVNLFFPEQEERARLRAELEKRTDIIISSSMPNNLELNSPDATKGAALLRLAGHLGLDREQTMAFGDGENDVSMIRDAGIGVAMGNGTEALKKAADYVTDTNDRDGVAAAIRRFL